MPKMRQVVTDNSFHFQTPGNFGVDGIVNNSALNTAPSRFANHRQIKSQSRVMARFADCFLNVHLGDFPAVNFEFAFPDN